VNNPTLRLKEHQDRFGLRYNSLFGFANGYSFIVFSFGKCFYHCPSPILLQTSRKTRGVHELSPRQADRKQVFFGLTFSQFLLR